MLEICRRDMCVKKEREREKERGAQEGSET